VTAGSDSDGGALVPPLKGVRVVDLTNVLAGPYATYQLAILGAEVVKVEVPGRGDLARRLGAEEDLNARGLGASFQAQNAGKKSVEIDLKTERGRKQLTRLLESADVLIENFRPGVLTRLGFSWERLQQINSELIYCSLSGFGQEGPLSDRPAYDQIVQGMAGIMSVTGTEESGPLRAGFPVCDTLGGVAAAFAITAALFGRARSHRAVRIDLSMLEVAISAMGWVVSNYLATGLEPSRLGNENFTAAPSGTFEAADRALNISANQQSQFEALCAVIERQELLADARFSDAGSRKQHRLELKHAIETALAARAAAEWERLLNEAGVPAARVLTVAEALGLEQLAEREFFNVLPAPHALDTTITVLGSGAHFNGAPFHVASPPPLLGEHNDDLGDD